MRLKSPNDGNHVAAITDRRETEQAQSTWCIGAHGCLLMVHLDVRAQGATYFISPPITSSHEVSSNLFNPQWLEAQGLIEGTAQGRAAAWFIRLKDEQLVLRHYRRGGLPARFSKDRFLWIGLRRSRPWRELSVLSRLHALGLPVPVPIAGRVQKKTVSYTADIITRRIPGARSLADFMLASYFGDTHDQNARDEVWRETGRVIRAFHAIGAHHADLNVRNILVDEQRKVWLIDWDRGRLNAGAAIQNRSMARLRRSLSREAELETMARQGWPLLMSAYSRGP